MKPKLIGWLAVIFVFISFTGVYADELTELKAQMKTMLEQNEAMKARMEEQARQLQTMQNKIEMLEVKGAQNAGGTETSGEVAAKVKELEENVQFLSEQQKEARSELLGRIKQNLYVTLEFESFADSNSSFDARNIELLLEGEMTDRLKAFTEIEFERTAKTSGDTDNRAGEVEVEQGWVEYGINDYFNPRFGVVLVPFGRYNLEHFDPFQNLTDRPIAMRRIIPTTWSEAGAGFTGRAALDNSLGGGVFEDMSVDYQFFVVNGLTDEFTDTGTRNARGAYGSDSNNNKATVGRLQFNVWGNQQFGVSSYYGQYDTAGNVANGFDADWKLVKGPFEFKGEYVALALEEGGLESGSTTTVPGYMSGYYVEAAYTFWFDFLNKTFLGRGFENPKFIGVLRYNEATIDDDGDTNDGPNREDGTTIGFNYRPNETFIYKFEYQFNHATNEILERGDSDGFIGSVTAAF